MKVLIFILFITIGYTWGQNLVPNPSFEEYTDCPENGSEIYLATPWQGVTNNSIDYFNACSSTLGVPSYCNCDLIFQYPVTGNAYAGLWGYNGIGNNYREYLQVNLNSMLSSNECYLVTFYANLQNSTYFAINNLGLHFSSTAFSSTSSSGDVLNLTPHILKLNNPIISDTMNWVKISGIYEANGNEGYILLGNFSADSVTDTLQTGNGTYPGAYYNIDDVSVVNISDLNNMPAYAGEDRGMIFGDSTFIGQEISNLNCTWTDLDGNPVASNTSGLYVHPTQTTSYLVEQTLCGVTTYDTVTVYVHGLGISSLEGGERKVSISPNPAKGIFRISAANAKSIALLDGTGRKVSFVSRPIDPETTEIECACENGLYYLVLTDNQGTHTAKVEIVK